MKNVSRQSGFNLVEMLVVLAIVSLLLLMTLPTFMEQFRKSHRTLARAELQKLVLRQERFFTEYHAYAETLSELGFPANNYLLSADGGIVNEGDRRGIYLVSMDSRGRNYLVQAAPIGSDQKCGTLKLDSLGVRGASGRAGVSGCW